MRSAAELMLETGAHTHTHTHTHNMAVHRHMIRVVHYGNFSMSRFTKVCRRHAVQYKPFPA